MATDCEIILALFIFKLSGEKPVLANRTYEGKHLTRNAENPSAHDNMYHIKQFSKHFKDFLLMIMFYVCRTMFLL